MSRFAAQLRRIGVLVTGRVEWVDESGDVEVEHMAWRTRWALFGIHSYNWKWVRDRGTRACGCTFNPITRRKLLTRGSCVEHCRIFNPVEPYHGKAKTYD